MNSSFKFLPFALAAMMLLVTGCPHNQYVIQLKPREHSLERTLVFYREDGANNDGTPNFQDFAESELGAIAAAYPRLAVRQQDQTYAARGVFSNELPADVGGMGAYSNLITSMGEAGFYAERFRGNDDLAGMAERRFQAANQLADLVMGWSEMELGHEPGYEKLRHFLDTDFRRDLKNAGAYWWEGHAANRYDTNAGEEFVVRFGQYLHERGYFALGEIPALVTYLSSNDPQASQGLMTKLQRLVAHKMGIPDDEPIPAALAFLGDNEKRNESFEKYLAGTDLFRARLKQWEVDKKQNAALARPNPDDLADESFTNLLQVAFFGGTPDHLMVQLSLPLAPVHSNGRWDEALKQVVWEANLPDRDKAVELPVICYANWARPNQDFQTEHLGKVVLTGDDLIQYCLWRGAQDALQGREWDNFLASLQPGAHLTDRVDAFRFSSEPPAQSTTNGQTEILGPSTYPRNLLKEALK